MKDTPAPVGVWEAFEWLIIELEMKELLAKHSPFGLPEDNPFPKEWQSEIEP